ncbi:regulator of telomere elongation helicase 1 homolog isoform X1 [Salvia splendens]|uniref:regulator of telomere elongation helicase 1 homolog isoform X1 n=1 Tax=Salvia splendens TaxID=180675 RepID=UPI001C275C49|nr:regulator of telomere elongation helicase 1 homolog isoform X1 [Salvia splendens]XP_042057084.1 regulator of telomere elongation helicase 1 homolog isoform X1 [Salvia splendens]
MPIYNIRGINVDFPYEAYDCQLVYMERVIESLQNKSNALLESPTGTGKTLCLLCATLAWRRSFGEFSRGRSDKSSIREILSQSVDEDIPQSQSSQFPTIVYTSRTHSQIKQVVKELKRSNYRPKMVVLGSREQLCIHDQVSLLRGKAQTNACRALCKKLTKRFCPHFSGAAEFVKKNPGIGEDPIDIEDLVNIGRSSGSCPYYLSREIHKDVDILFAPYNYLIDRGNRKSLKIDWKKCILIFDEAHNLESLCAEAASFDLPSSLLTACISEAKNCIDLSVARRDTSNDKTYSPDDFAILRALLLKLEKRIAEVPIESKELGFTKDGPYIYQLLSELNITQKTADMLTGIIEKACILLQEGENVTGGGGTHKTNSSVFRLESIGDIFGLIFKDNSTAHAQYYRFHVQEVEASSDDSFKGKTSRTLSWWCFNPGIAMEEFTKLGVRSIILTSGTLSPMDSFAEELKLEFPVRLENPHVISGNQIWAGVAPVGPSGYSFNSSYRNRGSIEYKSELGNAIVNFARIVPDGLLVFFPSYYLLEQCISCWKTMGQQNLSNSTTIWERICKHKLPVVEPRQSSLFPLAIDDYMTKLKEVNIGAVFFAVCRGKVSEGLDFADHAGRAVVITGLPFATLTDPKVRLKREYLDQHVHSRKSINKGQGLTGEEWYSQQTLRAINQAIGRVIRHRHDYGAIILCDERFSHFNRQSQISSWIRPHVKCHSKFGDVVYTLTRFFRDIKTYRPPKLEFVQNDNQEPARVSQSSPLSLDKINLEKLQTAFNPTSSLDSSSTAEKVKRGGISIHTREILPANRSTLASGKLLRDLKMKSSSVLSSSGKESLAIDGRSKQDFNETAVDLATPILLKKQKLLITGPTQSTHEEKSNHFSNMVKKEHLQFPENVRDLNPQETEVLVGESTVKPDIRMIFRDVKPDIAKHKDAVSETVSKNSIETKGSAFLVEVREKLTDSEYKEFVGSMKALKSNTMKISHALQSIARLFCLPDRLSLLHSFKDYVPAKYRSLYEEIMISTTCDAAGL